MAPKGRAADQDLAQQVVLQAVVLADSFASQFRPVTFEMPKVLMPIANVPMIEYTLEFLAAGGVQDIYVFCCAHADEVESYIQQSDLARRLATVSLHVLKSQGNCMSPGDALREVEAMGVIKNDFVLVPGDVVANISLAPLIAAHKARIEVDRDAVLTTVMSRVPTSHRARCAHDEKLVALSGETSRLLMYDDATRRDWEHKVRLPMALLQETDRFELHRDLYDTHIDVCTPELLTLLQDNFDWQDLRDDLLPGILGQFEMLGKTIYTHIVSTEYAARVHDLHTYDVVSRDLIQRWAFPLVPDANVLPGCTYRCTAHCVYTESDVALARSASLVRDCVVGAGARIGERTTVEASVIGRGCVIGAGVTLTGCYLWSNVIVEDGATLTNCVCCDNVVIGRGAMIPPGCVLARGIKVGAGSALARYARFWVPTEERHAEAKEEEEQEAEDDAEDEDDESELSVSALSARAGRRKSVRETHELLSRSDQAANGGLLGADGHGRLWRVVCTEASMGYDRVVAAALEEESEEEDDEAEMYDVEESEEETFKAEVGATVRRGIDSDHTVENLALEINSLKFSHNRTFADSVRAMVPALLMDVAVAETKKAKVVQLKKCIERWAALLARFIQSQADQAALVEAVVSTCASHESLIEVFDHTLKLLYDRDEEVLAEDAILGWADGMEGAEPGSLEARLLMQADGLLNWLREADDESDDDDDEEE